ncbi:hypothetical protein Hanom_Chr00s041327g01774481 [Helianthus anomalus]
MWVQKGFTVDILVHRVNFIPFFVNEKGNSVILYGRIVLPVNSITYKMTELPFSLTEKMDEVTQGTKMNGETFLDPQAKKRNLWTKLAKWPKPQWLKWHLTLIYFYTPLVVFT